MYVIQDYYKSNFVRTICHNVKDAYGTPTYKDAVNVIADYLVSFGVADGASVLVPAPQHDGKAEYTKEICAIVANRTGAKVADIVGCMPHRPFYDLKKENADIDPVFFLKGEIPPCSKAFFVDNVIGTGKTFLFVEALVKHPLEPLVYAVDYAQLCDEMRKRLLSNPL